ERRQGAVVLLLRGRAAGGPLRSREKEADDGASRSASGPREPHPRGAAGARPGSLLPRLRAGLPAAAPAAQRGSDLRSRPRRLAVLLRGLGLRAGGELVGAGGGRAA